MSEDFESFKSADGTEPPDGMLDARLERASVFESRAGDTYIKTEWSGDGYWWEALRGVSGRGKQIALEFVTALGVDVAPLRSWDDLNEELARREGNTYTVRVEHSSGGFLNTYVEAHVGSDVPIDTDDLPTEEPEPERTPAPQLAGFGDDDIPF